MTTKHTPGPWVWAPTGETMTGYGQEFAVAQWGTPNLVAGVFTDGRGGVDVGRANANLIAAAPELLEACELVSAFLKDLSKSNPGYMGKLVLQDYETWNQAMRALPAAIAKAEGK